MQGPRESDGQPASLNGQRPRLTYYTHDHTIRHNILAFNRDWQLAIWGDNPFFGPHPSAAVNERDEQTGKPFLDPEKLNLIIDHNLYFAEPGQGFIQYGAGWRPKSETYENLVDWQSAHSFDANSQFADPLFADWRANNFSLNDTSPAQKAGIGLSSPPRPDWDANQDGEVDISDLILVAEHLGGTGEGAAGDANGDGTVDILDLIVVAAHFGERYVQ